jgi:hypothetical protein
VVLAGVQFFVLFLLTSFHHTLLLPVTLPFIHWVAGDAGTHYPVFYFALPTVYSRVSLIASVLVSSLAVGAATVLFARIFGDTRSGGAWSLAARRYPSLALITLILAVLLYGVSMIQNAIPREAVMGSRIIRWGSRLGILAVYVLVETLFVYGSAWIILRGRSVLGAIRESVKLSLSTFVATYLIVVTPVVCLYPFSYLYGRADLFASKFKPETIGYLLGFQIILEVALGFFVVGAITRVFLYRTGESA